MLNLQVRILSRATTIMVKKVRRNEANFADLFRFAKEHHGLEWNPCNDLFFHTVLEYKRHNDFELADLEAQLKDTKYPYDAKTRKAVEIVVSFMKANKVKELRIMND